MKRFLAVPKVARALGSLIGSPVVGSCVPEHQLNWRYGNAALEEVGWDAGVCGGQVPAQHMQLVSFPPLPRPPRFSARLRLPAGQGPTAQGGLVRVMVLVPPLKVTGAVGKWVAGSMFPPAAQFSEPVQLPRAMSSRGLEIVVQESALFGSQPPLFQYSARTSRFRASSSEP